MTLPKFSVISPERAAELQGTAAPSSGDTREPSEVEKLRALCHALTDALAKRCLKQRNDERDEPNEWPGGQEWTELVGTSHSILRHNAWEESGWTIPDIHALLYDGGYPKPYAGQSDD